jgi:hypothetical protein
LIASVTSALRSARKASALSLPTIGLGVAAGATIPLQLVASKPGTPASAKVGMSGAPPERLVEVTAIALTLPARICGKVPGNEKNDNCTRPEITSGIIAPAPPLYGMCVRLMFAIDFSSSPARCDVLVVPLEAS